MRRVTHHKSARLHRARRRATRVSALLVVLLWSALVTAQGSFPALSITDTLFTDGLELRGVVEFQDKTNISLIAEPDTLAEFATRSARLLWTDDDGVVSKEHDVTGVLTHGLAFDGKWLWGIGPDPETGVASLVQIESDTLFVNEVYPLPGHRPYDLCWGENHIWLVDRDSAMIDKIDPETGDVRQSYLSPAFSPCGVAHDGRALWVTDYGTGRLYRMSKDGRRLKTTLGLDSYNRRGERIMLSWKQNVLWLIPSGAGYALRGRIE